MNADVCFQLLLGNHWIFLLSVARRKVLLKMVELKLLKIPTKALLKMVEPKLLKILTRKKELLKMAELKLLKIPTKYKIHAALSASWEN